MSKEDWEEVLSRLLEGGPGSKRDELLAGLSDGDRDKVRSLLDVADLVWEAGHGAPPLEGDPVAAMLGLLPDPDYYLDSKAFSQKRKLAGLQPSELARRLTDRGWKVSASDIFRWETKFASEVSPALVRAIADVLKSEPDSLITHVAAASSVGPLVAKVKASANFWVLVERFAHLQGLSRMMAASALESRMLATVHRGDPPDADQMLASLEALVRALETKHGTAENA